MLIVEDDVGFADKIRSVLQEQGWSVELATSGLDAMQLLTNFRFDFILLDWSLPEITGVEICRKYREGGGETPIIFVTGRNTIDDKESGFDAGGDDYITKPFDVRELLARVKALTRRPGRYVETKLSARGVVLDPRSRTIGSITGSAQLSSLESSILEFLMRNPNRFFSSSELFEAIWVPDAEATDETVRVRMRIIRQKLAKIGAEDLVETVRGLGYVIRDENTD